MPETNQSELEQELDWLYGTQLFGMKLGLDGITRLLHACGVATLPTGMRVIHVAGTNGKGSTCATIERIARAAGYRTGLFTSPHLLRFHERVRVQGEMIEDASLLRHIRFLRELIAGWDYAPTFFELVFALAMIHFCEQSCELLILETGMGGRLDATNAIAKDVAVITPIGLDHTQYLGETLAAIASEKAGIISQGISVISALQEADADAVLRHRCEEMNATLCTPPPALPSAWKLSLSGQHQRENSALALAALRALPDWEGRLRGDAIAAALLDVNWAGRFERVALEGGRPLILDGAHNPHAMRALVESWKESYNTPTPCFFACSADKELEEVIDLLDEIVAEWHLPPVNSPRVMNHEELAALIATRSEKPIQLHASLAAGLESMNSADSAGTASLVCGSFFLLGELMALLKGSAYRQTAQ